MDASLGPAVMPTGAENDKRCLSFSFSRKERKHFVVLIQIHAVDEKTAVHKRVLNWFVTTMKCNYSFGPLLGCRPSCRLLLLLQF